MYFGMAKKFFNLFYLYEEKKGEREREKARKKIYYNSGLHIK